MQMQFYDTLALDKPRRVRDGYMVSEVRAGRTGIQVYRGAELGIPDRDTIRVYRPRDEVFAEAALRTFTHLPITVDHPDEMVNSKNWRTLARGYTGDEVREEADEKDKNTAYVRVPLILLDEDAITEVENKQRNELSFGYTCELDFTHGYTKDGQEYDAIQRNIRGNHLAIVRNGRAGARCRFGDEGDKHMNLKTITIDGFQVETTEAGATALNTVTGKLDAANAEIKRLQDGQSKVLSDKDAVIADLQKKLGDKDKEIGTKDAEITKLKAEAMDETKIHALVTDLADVTSKARLIANDVDYKGKSVKDIRRMAIAKADGDAAVKDKSDEYIQGVFDYRVAEAVKNGATVGTGNGGDPIATFMSTHTVGDSGGNKQVVDAYRAMVRDKEEAWKYPFGKPDNGGARH